MGADGDRDDRASPEAFLELIGQSRRGRLKVYIGHAAGTGKTVQMLREANDLLARGTDVVGAFIETHGRLGTEAALGRLPLVPRRVSEYKGSTVEEMDLDAVLARRPAIAVVDELPHTNVGPGGRHPKRWQDVDVLLDAGISVITAMNIQHLASLGPVVEKISGVKVRETVPDSFLAGADQLVNIDIASSDLRERLRRGDVYPQARVEAALSNFFTGPNLTSLRELALREVVRFLDHSRKRRPSPGGAPGDGAAKPDHTAEDGADGDPHPPRAAASPVAEADTDPVVMVAASSRPPDIRSLLRKAAAIADRLDTHWYLAYVETPGEDPKSIDATTQRILMNNIALAKDLGATVVRLKGARVARTLADFAREYGVTHAIFGGSGPPRPGWLRLFDWMRGRRGVLSEFRALVPEIDIHICGTPPGRANGR